ncbi:Arginase/deacetylase [Daedaleopsis nitida]|nr:Arginase/deacetylase [Daedaleopsis nitida]
MTNRLSSIAGILLALTSIPLVVAHHHHSDEGHHDGQIPLDDLRQTGNKGNLLWKDKYGDDAGRRDDLFSGLMSFAHLPYTSCIKNETASFDIGILGMPFDTAVTYRPGARFGPQGIRSGSRRQTASWGYTAEWNSNPYDSTNVLDCGDVPVNPFNNTLAIDQMETAYRTVLTRTPSNKDPEKDVTKKFAMDGKEHPRIVSLGGDHTIVLPILRALNEVYGPVAVIHFDSHLDTWRNLDPDSGLDQITHGTYFYIAYTEGLIAKNSIHAGIRCKMAGVDDLNNDAEYGFRFVTADDIDAYGTAAIVKRIRDRIGDSPVYLSFDIDTIDPGLAPATGTPEVGGWTTREVKRIIRGLSGLNFVGADIVEVSPPFDHAEVTGIAAAQLIHDILEMMVTKEQPTPYPNWLELEQGGSQTDHVRDEL